MVGDIWVVGCLFIFCERWLEVDLRWFVLVARSIQRFSVILGAFDFAHVLSLDGQNSVVELSNAS